MKRNPGVSGGRIVGAHSQMRARRAQQKASMSSGDDLGPGLKTIKGRASIDQLTVIQQATLVSPDLTGETAAVQTLGASVVALHGTIETLLAQMREHGMME